MYQYPEIEKMSIAAIKKLNAAGIKCSVLTKGLLPFDLSSLSKDNEYGITLISLSEDLRGRIEPGSAPLNLRLAALRALHDAGCKTWVSIEPYPTPNIFDQQLDELLKAVCFVDRIVFGRINYSTEATAYKRHKQFFNECAATVEQFCADHGISCHIKNGTISE